MRHPAWMGAAVAGVVLAASGVAAAGFELEPFSNWRAPEVVGLTASAENAALGGGASLGGLLDAPSEGAWGMTLTPEMFAAAAEGGFRTLRLPVRFSNHAAPTAPYALDEDFMLRVDFALNSALSNGLNIIIDFHHYHQMDGDPVEAGEFAAELSDTQLRQRFTAIWEQIAQRYRSLPNDRVLFELYNEPHGKTTPEVWNELLAGTLAVVRRTNPYRFVIIDPTNWSTASGLSALSLPGNDQRLIVGVHNYEPYHFTMQGALWIENAAAWRGTTCCSPDQVSAMTAPLDVAAQWSKSTGRPIYLGEFGSNSEAPYADRVVYTALMREAAEQRGFSWAYWDFASGEFGPWDAASSTWRAELRDALIPH